jgi:tRNA threonylcarbamoyladenosine biosynthesis protein TsaE
VAAEAAPLLLHAASEEATLAIGAQLARVSRPLLGARQRAFVIALAGPLGAGKTTLVRGLLAEFGVRSPVRSPSYALLEHYETADCHAIHVDLYRLNEPSEVESLGLRDFDQAGWLWLLEWPERAGNALGAADLGLKLSIADNHHAIVLTPGSADGRELLRQLRIAMDAATAHYG